MTGQEQAQLCRLYLVSPPAFDLETFADALNAALEAGDVACFRLALENADDAAWHQACERLVPLVQSQDVAFLLTGHAHLVSETGADGIHVDGPVTGLQRQLPPDSILGAGCGLSRHEAMVAGEDGADYVAFGPWGEEAAQVLSWWQETMEPPCIAQGNLDPAAAALAAAAGADFVMAGNAVWSSGDGPAAAISALVSAIANAPPR